MQRQLFKTMEEGAAIYLKRFARNGGTLYGQGGDVDDAYEMFFNWPLFYAMGADEKLLHWALQQWNAITRQYTYHYPQINKELVSSPGPQLYKEFYTNHDWFHMSEGNLAFYDFGVADPTILENVERAKRFSGFYLNEDPEARNYDSVHKIIRSPFSGSKGPRFEADIEEVKKRLEWSSVHPLVKNLESDWDGLPQRRSQVREALLQTVMREDIPVNLTATGLMTNAYLYTGDEKYKQWVLDYVNAWTERVRQNRGVVPDNAGPTGKVGEQRQGQWWGGFWGWTTPFSMQMIYGALTVAAECAQLLTGDARYLELLRSPIDSTLKQAVMRDGQLVVPYKYGPEGWYDFRPMLIRDLAHLWHASMDPEDWERIETVRAGHKNGPLPYAGKLFSDWNEVESVGDRDDDNRSEYARLQYYAGRNADWPEKTLRADYQQVCQRLEFMRNDSRDIYSIIADELYPNNPVITKGLQQVSLGAPQTIYNGGLLRARVRYFDVDQTRPGLPRDVAALVEKLEPNRTVVQLINLSALETRRLILQAGAFGEHEFSEVKFVEQTRERPGKDEITDKVVQVNKKYFQVELPPATGIRLDIGTRRFVNRPSYAFPWHGNRMPVR